MLFRSPITNMQDMYCTPLSHFFYLEKYSMRSACCFPAPKSTAVYHKIMLSPLSLHAPPQYAPGALSRQAERAQGRTRSRPSTVHWPFCSPSVAPLHNGRTDPILFDTKKKSYLSVRDFRPEQGERAQTISRRLPTDPIQRYKPSCSFCHPI